MSRSVPILFVGLVAMTFLAVSAGGLNARASQPEDVPLLQGQIEAARAKLEIAQRVCHMFHDPKSGAPRGGSSAEANYLWSKRRMMAELELIKLDPTHGSEAEAIRRHLEWMKAWNKRVVESGALAPFDIATTEYYIAEAEAMLASVEQP